MENRKFKKPYARKRFVSPHDYHSGKTLGAAPVVMPVDLISVTRILTQVGESCTANTMVAIRESMKPTQKYDPDLQYKAEQDFVGGSTGGIELQTALAVGVKVGYFKMGETIPSDPNTAYFFVNQPGMDWFDAVRTTIYALYLKYGQVVPISLGTNWYDEWDHTPNGIISTPGKALLGGHDMKVAGFQRFNSVDYVLIQGSWGVGFGDQGLFRVPRTIFNQWFNVYGAGYVVDDPNLGAKKFGWFNAVLENMRVLLVALYNALSKANVPPVIAPDHTIPAPVPPQSAPATSKLIPFAQAIETHESFDKQFNNPGALRFTPYTKKLGATGATPSNFCIFKDYKTGFAALCTLIKDAAFGNLPMYKGCSILSFFQIYSPSSDGNNPAVYATFVAGKVGVDVNAKLKDII